MEESAVDKLTAQLANMFRESHTTRTSLHRQLQGNSLNANQYEVTSMQSQSNDTNNPSATSTEEVKTTTPQIPPHQRACEAELLRNGICPECLGRPYPLHTKARIIIDTEFSRLGWLSIPEDVIDLFRYSSALNREVSGFVWVSLREDHYLVMEITPWDLKDIMLRQLLSMGKIKGHILMDLNTASERAISQFNLRYGCPCEHRQY
jgi:hypothetical protein